MTFTPPTLVSIDSITLGPYAARGITMTLNPITGSAGLQRSVNGTLLDLTAPQFHKYQASISCNGDIDAPGLDNVWQGKIVTVKCLPGLGVTDTTDGTITLTMMVESWNVSQDEWGAVSNWTINLLEV